MWETRTSVQSLHGTTHGTCKSEPKSTSNQLSRKRTPNIGVRFLFYLKERLDSLRVLSLLNCFRPLLLLEINRDFLFPLPLLGTPRLAQRCAEHEMCLRIVRVDLDRFAQRLNRRFRMVDCNLRLAQTKPSFAITRI